MTMEPLRPCAICGRPGRYMQLSSHVVDDGDGGEITISNARIVECVEHGVRPVDQAENDRWRTIVYKQAAPLGPNQDSCYNCQRPRALVGQMYYYGHVPDQIRLCGECNEKIDYRDLTPLRNDN